MKLYRNTRTGVIIYVNCEIGGEWEPVPESDFAEPEPIPDKPAPVKPVKNKTGRKKSNGN